MSSVLVQSKPAGRHNDQSRSSAPTHFELAGVEKIHTLQNTQEAYRLDGVSPDNMTIRVIAGTGEDSSHAQMLAFKNKGHRLTLPESKLVAAQQQIAWFRKYLSP